MGQKPVMPEFLKTLRKEARVVAAWKITLICCVTLGSCVALLALLDLVDRFMPWKEDSIATLLGGAIGLLALAFVMLAFRAYRLRPKPQELAAKVEEANPELMDTLNCAVDLIENKGGDYNRMEDCVLKVAAEKTDANDPHAQLTESIRQFEPILNRSKMWRRASDS